MELLVELLWVRQPQLLLLLDLSEPHTVDKSMTILKHHQSSGRSCIVLSWHIDPVMTSRVRKNLTGVGQWSGHRAFGNSILR